MIGPRSSNFTVYAGAAGAVVAGAVVARAGVAGAVSV